MDLTVLLIPTYKQMLQALSNWLTKAGNGERDGHSLLSSRLADNMFPLATQIRFVCVQALEGVSRLRGEELPQAWHDMIAEGREGGGAPGTLDDAQRRITETLAFLDTVGEADLNRPAAEIIEHALPNGMIFDLSVEQYARDWALPQFYFHLMAAYAILRHAGVDLGKADYVAHMFSFIRPETIPGGDQ